MTSSKHQKKLIREHAKKMGCSYTAARAALGFGGEGPPPPSPASRFARCPQCQGPLSRRNSARPGPAHAGDMEDLVRDLVGMIRACIRGPAASGDATTTRTAMDAAVELASTGVWLLERKLEVQATGFHNTLKVHSREGQRSWPLHTLVCPHCTRLPLARLLPSREEFRVADDLEQVLEMLTTGIRRYLPSADVKAATNMMEQALTQLRHTVSTLANWEWPTQDFGYALGDRPLVYAAEQTWRGVDYICFDSEIERTAYLSESNETRHTIEPNDAALQAARSADQRVVFMKYLGHNAWRSVVSHCQRCHPEHLVHQLTSQICPNCAYEERRAESEVDMM